MGLRPRLPITIRSEAVAIDPDFADAHAELARSYSVGWFVSDRTWALAAAGRALELAPDSPLALLAYGGAEDRPERIPDAIRALERALAIQPDHPEAMHVLASLRIDYEADLEAALALQRRAAALDPTSGIYRIWQGWYELASGNVDAGLGAVRDAHALAPNFDTLFFLIWAEATALGPGPARETLAADPLGTRAQPAVPRDIEALLAALEGRREAARAIIAEVTGSEDELSAAVLVHASLILGDREAVERIIERTRADQTQALMPTRLRLLLGYRPGIDVAATPYPAFLADLGMPFYIYPEQPPNP